MTAHYSDVQPHVARRFPQLDALRGIAALFVVFNHYALAVPKSVRLVANRHDVLDPRAWESLWVWLRFTPLRLIVDGEAAVDFFFVLSGFVLALSLTREWQPQTISFYVKRIFRIYAPFLTVILLLALIYDIVPTSPSPTASGWLNGLLPRNGAYSLSAHLMMTGKDTILDPVMWTLIHEVRVSAVFPLIFFLIRRIGAVPLLGACLIVSIASSFGMQDSISGSWQATGHFLWMFVAGSAVSFHRNDIANLMRRFGSRTVVFLWMAAIMLLVVPFNRVWSDFLIGSGAILVILLSLSDSWLTLALNSPVPTWLGRVSYSLYLIHLPILILFLCSGMTKTAAVLSTFVLAEISYRYIEYPTHYLGVMISKALERRGGPAGWLPKAR